MSRTLARWLTVALLCAPVTLSAQDPDPLARLDPQHRLAIEMIVDSARQAGLPEHALLSRAATLGLAAGILFAAGDISAKLVVHGGWWLLALAPLVVNYALGTSVLQGAFQRGSALTTAGMATLATNAVPIVAGFVLLDEALPGGARGVLQIAAFASLVVSATFLGHPERARRA